MQKLKLEKWKIEFSNQIKTNIDEIEHGTRIKSSQRIQKKRSIKLIEMIEPIKTLAFVK